VARDWLFVSKPLRPPFRDGSTVLVRDLVTSLGAEWDVAYFGDPQAPLRGRGPVLPAPAMGYSPSLRDKLRAFGPLMQSRYRARGVHFFFTPNAVTSTVVGALRRVHRGRPLLQTVMAGTGVARHVYRLEALDRVVLHSRWAMSALVQAGLSEERLRCIYPAVQVADVLPDLPAARSVRVLYAGDLRPEVVERLGAVARALEGTDAVLEVACRPKGQHHGRLADALAAGLARETAAGRVRLYGEVPDLGALLQSATVQIFVADEVGAKVDLPLVLLEGLARGVPVLMVDQPPFSEILTVARDRGLDVGLALPPGELPEALRQLVDAPGALAARRGDAHRLAREAFALERLAREYADLYAELGAG
jgi:glycosyltransferase involved in cell wall biosynthesis